MIKTFSFRDLLKKDAKTICLSIGGIYAGFGVLALLMVKMQEFMLTTSETKPDDSFQNTMSSLHSIWNLYMPFLIIVGICYFSFGLFYQKIKADRYKINLVLSILSLIGVITYSVSCLKYIDVFSKSATIGFEGFKYIVYIIAGFGFLAVLAAFTIPQYRIGKKIKEQEVSDKL